MAVVSMHRGPRAVAGVGAGDGSSHNASLDTTDSTSLDTAVISVVAVAGSVGCVIPRLNPGALITTAEECRR